jgi:hypothetical protein
VVHGVLLAFRAVRTDFVPDAVQQTLEGCFNFRMIEKWYTNQQAKMVRG